jgi:uncharacterized membrane protein YdbT with pleckstrin-like domain
MFRAQFTLAKPHDLGTLRHMSEEQTIWKGTPSAALDFWLNLGCLLVLPIPWALGRWIARRNHVIEITTERLRITRGIFSKRTDEVELYRVRDTTFFQPFLLRMFGKGNLQLNTDDATTPVVTLAGIPADQSLRDRLRSAVEACRDRKRTRVSELGGTVETDEPGPLA